MESNQIKTIIFDIDGTMLDTLNSSTKSLQYALKKVIGKDYQDDELYFHFGITLSDALSQLGIDEDYEKKISDAINEYYYSDKKRLTIFPNIKQVLEELNKRGIYLGIVTSKWRSEYKMDFEPLAIVDYFKTVICADDTQKHKPDPEPFEKFLSLSKRDRETTIYIGDTGYDSASSHGANIKFGLALWGAKNKNVKAEYYFEDPLDILNILD